MGVKYSKTVKENKFAYDGELEQGLTVYFKTSKAQIDKNTIDIIKSEIKNRKKIKMGASRDNPPSKSLGDKLLSQLKNPNHLSYVIPLLREEGFCKVEKRDNAFWIIYTGND